ncbi:unnamed protein product, partial [Polarella glacialis]
SEIIVLGLVAAVEEAAEELSRFVQDPTNFQLRRQPDAACMAAAAAAATASASSPSKRKGKESMSFATTSVGSLRAGDFTSGESSHSADD